MLGKTGNIMVNSAHCMLCIQEELKQHQTERYTEKHTHAIAIKITSGHLYMICRFSTSQ